MTGSIETLFQARTVEPISHKAARALDEFVLLAARGKITDEVVEQMQEGDHAIHPHLALFADKAGLNPVKFLAHLRIRVRNHEYNEVQLGSIAPRLRELIDPRFTRPEIVTFRQDLATMAQAIVDQRGLPKQQPARPEFAFAMA